MTRYYLLPMETGAAVDDVGHPVAWASCPAIPGAYEEAATPDAARERLASLARRIIAEHLVRDDPLDPDIALSDRPPLPDDNLLAVVITEADLEAARAAPLLTIEQPEP